MDTLTVEIIADKDLSKNGLRRGHWQSLREKIERAREDGFVLGLGEMESDWQTPDKAKIDIVQYYWGKPFDYDGLACLCAPTIDGLVDAGILYDDDPKHVIQYTLTHEKAESKNEQRVAITITPIE